MKKFYLLILFSLILQSASFADNHWKYYTLSCEGTLEKNIFSNDFSSSKSETVYHFDEFLIEVDPEWNSLMEENKSLISSIEIANSSSFAQRFRTTFAWMNGYNTQGVYSPNSEPHPYFSDENYIKIKINPETMLADYINIDWDLTLSLQTGRMTQNIKFGADNRTFIYKFITDCNGLDQLQPFVNRKKEKPIYADVDPSELVAAASGTGFFINNDGNIVTNDHVVDGCEQMTILFDGKEYEANVVANDKENDIALLKTNFNNKNFFKIAKDDVDRSQNIKAVGYGFGKNYSSDIKVTAGIVNSLSGYNDNYSEFQMDAAIQSGNSGGPVINENGDVVGISVAALDSLAVLEDTGTLPQNVNYAIKASTLKQFLKSKEINFSESDGGWFSFTSNRKINKLIDSASVYLSCYMTYAQIKENSTKKVMFENLN